MKDRNAQLELPVLGPVPRAPRRRRALEATMTLVMWCAALGVMGILAWIVGDVAWRGWREWTPSFFIDVPSDAGRAGGIFPMILSTVLVLVVALTVAVPLSLATAVWLSEFTRGRRVTARTVRRSLEGLAAVPSIIFGLFGNAFFCIALGLGYSILSGGLTLACMVLPILTRVSEEAIRAVPEEYRLAAAGLGLSRGTTIRRIVLPAAAPGLAGGLALSIGRVFAETAALLLTAGYVMRTPESLLDSGRVLSVHIYDMAMNVPGGDERAYATAFILVVLIVATNLLAVRCARRGVRLGPDPTSQERGA